MKIIKPNYKSVKNNEIFEFIICEWEQIKSENDLIIPRLSELSAIAK